MMVYDELLDNLEQSYSIHLQLKTCSEQKKEAIVANNLEELNRIVNTENKLVQQIQVLDEQRQKLANMYLQEHGFISAGQPTLSALIGVTHQAQKKHRLTEIHTRLSGLLRELKELNQLNQQLIEQSLSYLQFQIGLLVDDGSDTMIYHNPGQPAANKGYSSFDTKI